MLFLHLFHGMNSTAKIVKGYRRHEWQKMRERNEALDCRVYARAAAAQAGMDRFTERHWTDIEARLKPKSTIEQPPDDGKEPEQKRSWLGDRQKKWLGR